MTVEEAKKILNRVRDTERAYRLAKDKADRLRLSLTGGKAAVLNFSGASHVKDSNSVERAYCQLADYDAEADRLLAELVNSRKQAEEYINRMKKPSEREVLTRRYIMGQLWEDIAEAMGYEGRYTYKIHKRALESMAKDS